MINLISILLLIASVSISFSQIAKNLSEPIPIDPDVKIGKLDNGLTYYIRYNKKPEKRAEFFLTVNAGAILETDEQNGLAHFCEHMAFNGTEHFK